MVSVYENRKNLALTLKDTRTVVGKLETILGVGIHGVCFLFYLSIFNVDSLVLLLMILPLHHLLPLSSASSSSAPLLFLLLVYDAQARACMTALLSVHVPCLVYKT